MQIDNTVLEKLEKLSHLRIDDSKKEEVMGQLSEILGYIDNLNELNTDHLDAAFSTLKGGTPLREDIPRTENNIARDILSRAPESKDDFFIVPAIIE
ncbi:Asp-tRNA(Asn)/Glu-tRNA(Gln) amidotransferase subunit GatC [Sulfurovum sp. NBC37-1]|uniref:Aspartyl/glutamyl-tRNA(Asn/Gln) amidotransferase subunit C n=1 Tax=Sulfurovum sp. (strain NBC37-1) TaxID=387093 RepID=GATC_SULNB|nr:Asp-tRNA(Asn)/Glu-tRNA(Gln) amidotransferase subunit GatC [Sulfurovum sp. NBC37-1]A6Q7I8.1 RecName: Full=Aspartyl/glutamyl-tRNA(Asn/Gln) amidotransferase subunit C; Short=Asp/Glu-ADT subunit C [Sulfurovum sp. NBC37-1]BAF71447.1 glutamyl-tRNA amidotransferase subunit C [Sulfurovum sp. NBC37-1]